ncbi:MAG: alpha/beta fold hydrolase [Ginsengibacter sp.]
MNKNNFSRRQFITSAAVSSLGLLLVNPASSFTNVIDQLSGFQKSGLLFYIDSKGKKRRVSTLAEWQIKKKQILDGTQQAMGPLPGFSGLPGMDIQTIDEQKEENYSRLNISFTVAPNEKVSAYLYVPFQKEDLKKLPAMLALHPTGDLGKKITDGQSPLANRAYAKELAQRGYVVIAPDYPGFGDMKDYDFTTDRYQSGTMKAIFDNMRCVDLLQARPDVDPSRIGVIGHSLGGHNAIFTGAFDKRLKIIVSSCGWTLLDYYNAGKAVTEKYGGALGPWAQERYMPWLRDKYNLDVKKIPFDFDEVIAALAPRAFFSNSPLNDGNFNVAGVRKGIAEISEVYRFLGAKDKLEVRYPESQHDFPAEVRFEAYSFIDKILKLNS